jgi:hypothetical protein
VNIFVQAHIDTVNIVRYGIHIENATAT